MKHSSIYGAALIIGSLGATVTMIFHPTGHDLLGQPDEIARRNEMITVILHSLALFSSPLLLFGFFGFSRRLGLDNPLVSAALIAYLVCVFGGISAAIINGIVAPSITRQILTADENARQVLQLVLMNNTLLNQAFTRVYIVASSLAIILWSLRIKRNAGFAQIIAFLGCLIGSVTMLGLFSGHLRLNVHGFGLLILGQTVWTILTAVFLFHQGDPSVKDQQTNLIKDDRQ
jgi:hypothetical protein